MPRSNIQEKLRPLAAFLSIIAAISLGSCRKIRTGSQGGGYTDSELRAIRGVQVSTSGYETTFKIPWAETFQGDKNILFTQLTKNYVEAMDDLRKDFENRKALVKGFDKVKEVTEYNDQIRDLVDKLAKDASKDPSSKDAANQIAGSQAPEIYTDVSKQNLVQAYLPPGRALVLYAGANFKLTSNALKAGAQVLQRVGLPGQLAPDTFLVNVSLVYIVQLFVVVTVNNHTKNEVLNPDGSPRRGYQVDGALMLMPSVGGGKGGGMALTGGAIVPAGKVLSAAAPLFPASCSLFAKAGAGLQMQFGAGILLGPLDTPHDLMGYGGVNFDIDTGSVMKGWYGRMVALGKFGKAPVFLAFAGYDVGCGASSMTVSGTGLLDPRTFAVWVNSGADPNKIKDLHAMNDMMKNAGDPSFQGSTVDLAL